MLRKTTQKICARLATKITKCPSSWRHQYKKKTKQQLLMKVSEFGPEASLEGCLGSAEHRKRDYLMESMYVVSQYHTYSSCRCGIFSLNVKKRSSKGHQKTLGLILSTKHFYDIILFWINTLNYIIILEVYKSNTYFVFRT